MSPTTILHLAGAVPVAVAWSMVAGRCTRGGGRVGGAGRGYTGYLPGPIPGPIFSHIPETEPYLRPNEGYFQVSDEVSEIGS